MSDRTGASVMKVLMLICMVVSLVAAGLSAALRSPFLVLFNIGMAFLNFHLANKWAGIEAQLEAAGRD